MNQLAITLFWVLLGLVAMQSLLACGFTWILFHWKRRAVAEAYCPKAAVVLCLRGTDPFLPDCLEALLNQDYPNYDVRIVVDSREDPAWSVAGEFVERCGATNVEISPLTERYDTCSLKCSSVVQAVSQLDDSYEVVALLDADTVAHSGWLRELVAPLASERVGAATGNRWYMPEKRTWGALIRYAWNAAAVVQMCFFRIPWGGSLALKTKIFRESDLLDRWKNAFCEDTMLYGVLRKQKLRVDFVPSLMMVNREACSIPNYFRWVRRQLLTARLYHPRWPGTVAHGIATSAILVAALAVAVVAIATGQWETLAWAGGGIAAYMAAMVVLLIPMEVCVRRIVRARGDPTAWLGILGAVKLAAAIGLTQVVYPIALVSTMFVRVTAWRGVSYRIRAPFNIQLMEYHPYEADSLTQTESL